MTSIKNTVKTKLVFTIILLGIFSLTYGQQASTWENWTWLIGDWEGEGSGQPGQGGGTFSFEFKLDQNIIERKSHSEYAATENNPRVIHDDLMIIYLDFNGTPSKAIYFDNEGHTINYSISYSDKSIVMTSNKIPNAPVFRLTYSLLANSNVNTKFEMSQDGEKFINYLEGESKKISKPNH